MGDTWVLEEPEPRQEGDEKREYPLVPDGSILEAKVVSIQKKPKPYNDDNGDPVVKVEFRFKITDEGDYKGQNIWGETSTHFTNHPDCKMRSWVQEILGVSALPKGYVFVPANLVGEPCRIVIGVKEWEAKSNGQPVYNEDGTVKLNQRNFVQDVIPSRTAAVAMAGFETEEIF